MARQEDIILDFEIDTGDSVQSIEDLTKASKALREERKLLNINSKEGQQRIKEINAELDKNNEKIKDNVSALEKQKINIGNYRSALDGVHPALGKVSEGLANGAEGFKKMTMQALRFIATPLGAVLAAIVAVFTLLKSALSQNDALMDKFENITNAVAVVLEVVVARVGKLGEALIALATGNFTEAINKTAEAFGGLADEIENATRQQQIYLDASRELEDAQRNLRLEQSKSVNQIKLLDQVAKNSNKTFDEREAALNKSIDIQKDLIETSEDLARRDLLITARRLRVSKEFQQQSNETFDDYVDRLLNTSALSGTELDKLVDKAVALENARNSSLDLQQKTENDLAKIQNERALALEKQNKALEEQAALREANARAAREEVRSSKDGIKREDRPDELSGAFQTGLDKQAELEITENFNERINKANDEAYREDVRNKKRAEEDKLYIQETKQGQILETTERFLEAGAAIADRESAAFKAISTAQTLISTFQTAQLAYKSAFLPVATVASPALGAINAAIATALGLASVARINGVEFAEGGWTGPGNKYDVAGVVHRDEYVTPKRVRHMPEAQPHLMALERMRLRGYADGGLTTSSISTPINQQLEIVNIVKNMPAPVVGVKEVTKMQNRVRVKESISKR